MKVAYTPHFKRKFRKFSGEIQKRFKKQIDYLIADIHIPHCELRSTTERGESGRPEWTVMSAFIF